MEQEKLTKLTSLVNDRLNRARKYLDQNKIRVFSELKKAEEAEIPGFENIPVKFGQFVEKEFVVMMTDIRKSTEIINGINGVENMFVIFYAYSALVAYIVDTHMGTSTEFLGDGVINLFDCDGGRDQAFRKSMLASQEILYSREYILNPALYALALPTINIGIGIDFGNTIVTRFGYKQDNDLKAFGKCVYNVTRLSKGINEIDVSAEAKQNWPSSPGGTLVFEAKMLLSNELAYRAYSNS